MIDQATADLWKKPAPSHRVLVCGGRDFSHRGIVFSMLDLAHQLKPISELIHGGAAGADTFADEWAQSRGVFVHQFDADWATLGKAAGPIRNQAMLDRGQPDLVIAFPGGPGTADMVRRAKAAGVPVSPVTPHRQ